MYTEAESLTAWQTLRGVQSVQAAGEYYRLLDVVKMGERSGVICDCNSLFNFLMGVFHGFKDKAMERIRYRNVSVN